MWTRIAPRGVSWRGLRTLRIEALAGGSGGRGANSMSVEFVGTNVLVYAHDGGAGAKHDRSVELLRRLTEDGSGALSIQVLGEFYVTATKKLGMTSQEAEEGLLDLGGWIIHRPSHADLLRAARLHRRYIIHPPRSSKPSSASWLVI